MLTLEMRRQMQTHGHTRWNILISQASLVLCFLSLWLCWDCLKCSSLFCYPQYYSFFKHHSLMDLPQLEENQLLIVLSFFNVLEATDVCMFHQYLSEDPLCARHCTWHWGHTGAKRYRYGPFSWKLQASGEADMSQGIIPLLELTGHLGSLWQWKGTCCSKSYEAALGKWQLTWNLKAE